MFRTHPKQPLVALCLELIPDWKSRRTQPRGGFSHRHSSQSSLGAGGWSSMAVLSWGESQALSSGGLSGVLEKFNVFYYVPAFVFMCLSRIFR